MLWWRKTKKKRKRRVTKEKLTLMKLRPQLRLRNRIRNKISVSYKWSLHLIRECVIAESVQTVDTLSLYIYCGSLSSFQFVQFQLILFDIPAIAVAYLTWGGAEYVPVHTSVAEQITATQSVSFQSQRSFSFSPGNVGFSAKFAQCFIIRIVIMIQVVSIVHFKIDFKWIYIVKHLARWRSSGTEHNHS